MLNRLLLCLLLLPGIAQAQFVNGQVLTATQLNNAFAATLPLAGGTLTGPLTVPSLSVTGSPIGLASGGTNCSTVSGACLDNITGFSSTGFLERTGAGTYTFVADPLPASHGGTGVTSVSSALVTSTGGSTARTLAAHFGDVIYARDRGVKCDGSTDDTSAINAITSTTPLQNARLQYPPGVCVFSGTLTYNIGSGGAVAGAGSQATLFVYNGASTTNDLIVTNTTAYNPVIEGFSIWSSTRMTAGSALHVPKSSYAWVRDVQAFYYNATTNNLWNGIWIDQPNFFSLDGFYFQAQNDAIAVSALGVGSSNQYDVFINNGKVANSAAGLHIGGGVDNVHADNVEATTNTINVLDDNALEPYKNQEIFLGPNFVTDQAVNYNYYINDADCNLTNYGIVHIGGVVTAAQTFDNIFVNSFPGCQLVVTSPLITAAARDGIRMNDTTATLSISPSTLITGNTGNGVNATAAYTGMKSQGQVYGNTAGQFSANVTQAALSASTVNGVTSVSVGGVALKPVLSGTTGSIGGSSLAAGACVTATASITGAGGTMVAVASPASGTDPGTNFTVRAFVNGANSAAVYVCAITAGTPTATTYNVRVLQ